MNVSSRYLRTTDIAYAVAVHPNTVRMYETWGLLPPIPRAANGYRQFTEAHLDQMRLCRSAMHFTWLGGDIRHTLYAMIDQAAKVDLGGALEQAYRVLGMIRSERVHAETAVALLERWALGTATDATAEPLHIGQVAELLNVTRDMLRNWERNGLIKVPRDPHNHYRLYGPEEIGRLRVIRTLRRARYSTMAILRMLLQLDQGRREGLRQALDTPGDEEDVYDATDHWLSTLARLEPRAEDLIAQLEVMIQKQAAQKLPQGNPVLAVSEKLPQGRATVVRQFSEVVAEVLNRITPLVEVRTLRLVGTAAALLQGVFLPTLDVNFLAKSRACVDTFHRVMDDFPCLRPPAWDAELHMYEAVHIVRGIEVGMAMMARETPEDALEVHGEGPWEHATPIAVGAHTLLAVKLELRLATELARDRAACTRPLLKHLRKHGCDIALLQRAMAARDIPDETWQSVLAELR